METKRKERESMTTKTLTTPILCGPSRYPIGTKVQSSEVIDEGTWDERVWVIFPHGEGTYLIPDCVK
jgi:hypothetical protein